MNKFPEKKEKHEQILAILRKEVAPALGCTAPTAVSFTVSAARDAVGGQPKSVRVWVDKDTYKNSVSVGIPGTSKQGLVIAAALGAIAGDSKAGLEVLKNIKPGDEAVAEKFSQDSTEVKIKWDYEPVGLLIEAFVETERGTGHAVVVKTHTNLILQEANGEVIYKAPAEDLEKPIDYSSDPIRAYTVKDFLNFSREVEIKDIEFLDEAVEMNRKLALAGMGNNVGAGFGAAFNSFEGDSIYLKAKALTAAASDARMAGKDLAAMSCASSGNVGITASLPLVVLSEALKKKNDELLRAISLSFLLTIYLKSHIGRLSAMCACAIAAGLGVTAGSVYLLGGGYRRIEMAIHNVVGSIGGVICDGAKLGCALKLSTAVGVAIESAYLAMKQIAIPDRDGIVFDTADQTIAAVGKIAVNGMMDTDKIVCQLIIDREQGK
jgi:L-cysteine desulfidase